MRHPPPLAAPAVLLLLGLAIPPGTAFPHGMSAVVVPFVESVSEKIDAEVVEGPPDLFIGIPAYPLLRAPESGPRYPLEAEPLEPKRYEIEPRDAAKAGKPESPASTRKRERERLQRKASRIAELHELITLWTEYDRSLDRPSNDPFWKPVEEAGRRDPEAHAQLREWLLDFPLPASRKSVERLPDARVAGLEDALFRYERFVDAKARRKQLDRYCTMAELLLYDVRAKITRISSTLTGTGASATSREEAADQARASLEEQKAQAAGIGQRNALLLSKYDHLLKSAKKALERGGQMGAEAILREIVTFLLAEGKIANARIDFEEDACEILRSIGPQNVLPPTIEAMGTESLEVRDYLHRMACEFAKDARKPLPKAGWKREEWIGWYESSFAPWPFGEPPTLEGLDLSPVELLPALKGK